MTPLPGGSLRSPPSSSPFSGLEPNCRPQLPVCSYWGWSHAPHHALWSWIVPPDCSRSTFEPEGKTLWSVVCTVYVTNTLNVIFLKFMKSSVYNSGVKMYKNDTLFLHNCVMHFLIILTAFDLYMIKIPNFLSFKCKTSKLKCSFFNVMLRYVNFMLNITIFKLICSYLHLDLIV